jgi:hypothetical protein
VPYRVPIAPRLARLARTRSLRTVAETVRRAGKRDLTCRRIALQLSRAARSGRPVLVGPFLGEVGFELLYWIPMLRRLLEQLGVPAERVTVLTRGGAGRWYRDFAANEIEILDLVTPAELSARLAERRIAAGDAKQLTIEALDRELVARALAQTGPAAVVHPILMFSRLRWVWQEVVPVPEIVSFADYRPLPRPEPTAEDVLSRGRPDEYVVLKPYFSDCFPAGEENREFLRGLVNRLSREIAVVVLSSGFVIDDHEEWRAEGGARVYEVGPGLQARDNLAVQSGLVAGARALVSTYGGFSYLGPLLGVPTMAFRSNGTFNATHLAVLREALPGADYDVAEVGDREAFENFVRRCASPIRAGRP